MPKAKKPAPPQPYAAEFRRRMIDLVRSGGRIVDFKLVGKTPDAEMVTHMHGTQLTAYSVLYRDATGLKFSGFRIWSFGIFTVLPLSLSDAGAFRMLAQ